MPERNGVSQEQNLLTKLSRFGSNLIDSMIKKFSTPEKSGRNRLVLLVVTALMLTVIILPSWHNATVSYKIGDIAPADIRVSKDLLVEAKSLTEQRRKDAANNAPVVYNLSDQLAGALQDKLQQAVVIVRTVGDETPNKNISRLRAELTPLLDTNVSDAEITAFTKITSDKFFLTSTSELLKELFQRKIVLDANIFQTDIRRGLEITDNDGHKIGVGGDFSTSFTDIDEARRIVSHWSFKGVGNASDNARIAAVIARIILPNLFYNREASEARSHTAMETVRPVLFKLQKGEMVVRVGERITAEQAQKLDAIFGGQSSGNWLFKAMGTCALIMVLFYFPYRFACKNIRKFNPTNKDLLLISLLIIISFVFFKTALLITHNIGAVFPSVDASNYFYLFPFAAGAMIVRIFINSEVALVCCAITAPLIGIMFENSIPVVIYSLLGGVIGAHAVSHCTSRSTIYTAGIKVSVVNMALALSFQTANNAIFTMQTLYVVLFSLFSGFICAGFVSSFTPLVETLFQYTTDIKLLELANLNSPVLRELMVKAPGTYHHSIVVGNLVEAAAESIGANPLLARVSAYYHDIGKAAKPLYFIENQGDEENRHDKLTPSMSALILISHIKDGIELAREYRLGQPIFDIIRQHHGTALIKYFYERAKSQAKSSDQVVEEKDFRYPGPKPQTREAGIVMLADCVEAASRTLVAPTSDRIQGLVQKLINNVFIDGQLDECELTLKNLHEIARSFTTILNGIYHHRIEYPEPAHKGGDRSKKSPVRENGKIEQGVAPNDTVVKQPPEAPLFEEPTAKKSGCENLKRLGMS